MADILLVDDDSDATEILGEVLRELGHRVRFAHNGKDGLAAVHAHLPDLAVLDVEMPILTGPEMAYQMFLHDLGMEEVPVILCSGVLDLDRTAAAVGTPYFLAKPYTLAAVLALVERALRDRTPPHPHLTPSPP